MSRQSVYLPSFIGLSFIGWAIRGANTIHAMKPQGSVKKNSDRQVYHSTKTDSVNSKSASSSGSFLLGVVGDILLHKEQQEYAFSSSFAAEDLNYNGSYASIWQDAIPLLRWPDITYGNLEGVVSTFKRVWPDKTRSMNDSICEKSVNWKTKEYGGVYHSWDYEEDRMRNWFNYHPDLITDLKYSGFDFVSTANNHMCDVCVQGIEEEIDLLNEKGLPFSGSRKLQQIESIHDHGGEELPTVVDSGSKSSTPSRITITEKNGLRIGWASCTGVMNSFPIIKENDGWKRMHCNKHQVALCQDEIFYDEIRRAIQNKDCDGVIVMIHAGEDYSKQPSPDVRKFAQRAIDAGAFLVLGNHPHVPQSITRMKPFSRAEDQHTFVAVTEYGDVADKAGNTLNEHRHAESDDVGLHKKDPLVVWSIGNFVSHQSNLHGSSGMLFFQVEGEQDINNNSTRLYVPCYQFQPFCMREKERLHVIDMSNAGDPCAHKAERLAGIWRREYMRDTAKPGNFQCNVFNS